MTRSLLVSVLVWTAVYCSLGNQQFSEAIDVLQLLNASKDEVFFCRQPPSKTDQLKVVFPEVFSVAIEAVNSANGSLPRISDILESRDSKLSAVSRFEDGIEYQYIFNQTSSKLTFVNDSTTCKDGIPFRPFQTTNLTENDPLLFPNNITLNWWNNVSSIVDIWAWATTDTKIYKTDEHGHEHGIPVDHYYVCKQGQAGYVFEIEICVTQTDVKLPIEGLNHSLPLRIDVKYYKNDSNPNATISVDQFVGYRLSNYKSISDDDRERAFLPPPGVPCNIDPKSRASLPELPNTFSVSIDYVDEAGRKIAVNQLSVDSEKHFLAFHYSNNDTGLLLPAHADTVRGKIVHDFVSGIEYVIDPVGDTCVNTSDLPLDYPDVELDETSKREVIMKNASELLGVHLEHGMDFYYVGQRLFDDNIPSDVWLSYAHENETSGAQSRIQTVVHEAYFSKPDWKSFTGVGSAPKPVLLAVKTYVWPASNEPKAQPVVKTLRYHDFTIYSKSGVPLREFDVTSCLGFSKNDSYLVAFGNDSLSNVDKKGRAKVENAFRQAIADTAGISPLRVNNFYFEAVNDTFWVFFFVSERANTTGTKTKWFKESITAKDARLSLNKTMVDKALTVPVLLDDGSTYSVALNKSSLSAVPPYFTTPIIHNDIKAGGYTGGSMAALGICMLLIGGVLGMVLAFFMWKRNRGIAYQIYE